MKTIINIILACVILLPLTACSPSGNDPDALFGSADLKVDDYEITYRSDNMERDNSTWNNYCYHIRLKPSTIPGTKARLEKLVATNPDWKYIEEKGEYEYHINKDTYSLLISIDLNKNFVVIDYLDYDWL